MMEEIWVPRLEIEEEGGFAAKKNIDSYVGICSLRVIKRRRSREL